MTRQRAGSHVTYCVLRRLARCILEREPREIAWTACGQRVGLMTRTEANRIDPGAAHSPPPFPTVLTLEPCSFVEYLCRDRIRGGELKTAPEVTSLVMALSSSPKSEINQGRSVGAGHRVVSGASRPAWSACARRSQAGRRSPEGSRVITVARSEGAEAHLELFSSMGAVRRESARGDQARHDRRSCPRHGPAPRHTAE